MKKIGVEKVICEDSTTINITNLDIPEEDEKRIRHLYLVGVKCKVGTEKSKLPVSITSKRPKLLLGRGLNNQRLREAFNSNCNANCQWQHAYTENPSITLTLLQERDNQLTEIMKEVFPARAARSVPRYSFQEDVDENLTRAYNS